MTVQPPRAPGAWWAVVVAFVLRSVLYRTTVHHRERVGDGAVILAINHLCVLDGPLVYAVNRRVVHMLVKQEMFHGFLGWVLRQVGQIPVKRGGGDRTAMQTALAGLRSSRVVGIFPEGTRGRGDLASVRTGVAWLALQSGAPVLPVACLGTRRSGEPNGAMPPLRRRLHVVFGEPFEVERQEGLAGRQALVAAAEQVRVRLAQHISDAVELTGEPLPVDAGSSS